MSDREEGEDAQRFWKEALALSPPVLIVGTYDESGVPDAMNAPVLEELPVIWECELVRITEEGTCRAGW